MKLNLCFLLISCMNFVSLLAITPLKIIESNHRDHSLTFNRHLLLQILNQDSIKDRNLVILSITGSFSEGKSFLLNILLHYLRATYALNQDDWLNTANQTPLNHFPLRSGPEEQSTNLLIWPEVFLTETNDDKLAIIVIDTQGAFDSKIFALASLLSSKQIYNLMRNFRQDHITRLEYLTGLERYFSTAPFQDLMILIRDWPWPYEKPFGLEGGRLLLEQVLEDDSSFAHDELKKQRRNLRALFSNISCFLMAHPGQNIAGIQSFNGDFSVLDAKFVENIKILAPLLLGRSNLVVKAINGVKIRAGDLVAYLDEYVEALRGLKSDFDVKQIFEATLRAQKKSYNEVEEDKEEYVDKDEEVIESFDVIQELIERSKDFLNHNYDSLVVDGDYLRNKDVIVKYLEAKARTMANFAKLVKQTEKFLNKELDEEFLSKYNIDRILFENLKDSYCSKFSSIFLSIFIGLLVIISVFYIHQRMFNNISLNDSTSKEISAEWIENEEKFKEKIEEKREEEEDNEDTS